MLLDLQPDSILQGELAFEDDESMEDIADKSRLMTALDTINQRFGKGTMKMASAGLNGDRRVWSMKQERRTPGYTTNWDDIPVARA
jgi:DNA polymerase V